MKRDDTKKILAIETSCDETAVAVVEVISDNHSVSNKITKKNTLILNTNVVSNIVSSQINLHAKYGGVYPELASREHIRNVLPAITKALSNKRTKELKNKFLSSSVSQFFSSIDAIAVTTGPGLIGSLLPGVNTAKTLSYIFNKPIYPINHIEGHIYTNFIGKNLKLPNFPVLALVVSGGHTSLIYMKDHLKYEVIGETLDDAAGEAFDKVAKLLELGYPGGPAISKIAEKGNLAAYAFPRAMVNRGDFDFSFSGLKTAVLYESKKHKLTNEIKADLAASFQQAVIDILISKTIQAAYKFSPKSICLCGGVSANKNLREQLKKVVAKLPWKASFYVPPMEFTTDNATMVGIAAAYRIALGKKPTPWYDVNADANAKL